MDGIDGIAALQAVVAGTLWLIAGLAVTAPQTAFLGGVTAAASLGFLALNWQPAKIFMGDVGSAFLGFVFATLPIAAVRESEGSAGWGFFGVAVLFVGMFVFDSVLTFFRRLVRGEKVWLAHREHLYQRLVISGRSHATATILFGIAGIFLGAVGLAMYPFYVISLPVGLAACALIFGGFAGIYRRLLVVEQRATQ
jgi:UDP-N-acetylmuramyl pentapeptide phosphotransferase/UDP-N-acetylglucosamine-1-phosphate transferase